jgi:nicotinamidase-related amidase
MATDLSDGRLSRAALLVVDTQVGVWRSVHQPDHYAAVIAYLVGRARADGVRVIWIQQTDDSHLVEGSRTGCSFRRCNQPRANSCCPSSSVMPLPVWPLFSRHRGAARWPMRSGSQHGQIQ